MLLNELNQTYLKKTIKDNITDKMQKEELFFKANLSVLTSSDLRAKCHLSYALP